MYLHTSLKSCSDKVSGLLLNKKLEVSWINGCKSKVTFCISLPL